MLVVVSEDSQSFFPEFHVKPESSKLDLRYTRLIEILIVKVVKAAVILLNHVPQPVKVLNVSTHRSNFSVFTFFGGA